MVDEGASQPSAGRGGGLRLRKSRVGAGTRGFILCTRVRGRDPGPAIKLDTGVVGRSFASVYDAACCISLFAA